MKMSYLLPLLSFRLSITNLMVVRKARILSHFFDYSSLLSPSSGAYHASRLLKIYNGLCQ